MAELWYGYDIYPTNQFILFNIIFADNLCIAVIALLCRRAGDSVKQIFSRDCNLA
ncbi:MAG: hypothetical protein MST10_06925 [Lentisphaeria bacterium]|nr:hypothetical protein [Lentisphaeria bacterium]